ncbi:MAG: class I SAM-dependent methyltransferase [Bacteroidetes bacterium]|nr:class I SAM-dependent methyltransferase [Bacteroidota bacterium]
MADKSTMITITTCPICNSNHFKAFIKCEDFTVSRETFTIQECSNCTFKFTNPRPADNDLGKYYQSTAYISHSGTKEGFVNKVYHLVRNYTLKQKVKLINTYDQYKTSKYVLDIGCGSGHLLNALQKNSIKCFGLEPDEQTRQTAIKNFRLDIHPSEHLFSINAESVTTVTMFHVLEHVGNLNEYLSAIHSILKPNGTFIVAVPNYQSSDALHYDQLWAAYDVPRHLNHFSAETITQLASNNNFKLSKILPMHFDGFYVSMLSEKYKGNKGLLGLLLGALQGLVTFLKSLGRVKQSSSLIYIFKNI